jgi:hypothetical protein
MLDAPALAVLLGGSTLDERRAALGRLVTLEDPHAVADRLDGALIDLLRDAPALTQDLVAWLGAHEGGPASRRLLDLLARMQGPATKSALALLRGGRPEDRAPPPPEVVAEDPLCAALRASVAAIDSADLREAALRALVLALVGRLEGGPAPDVGSVLATLEGARDPYLKVLEHGLRAL